jgi:hypothetical protein
MVTVNFGDAPFTLLDGTVLAARGHRVMSDSRSKPMGKAE